MTPSYFKNNSWFIFISVVWFLPYTAYSQNDFKKRVCHFIPDCSDLDPSTKQEADSLIVSFLESEDSLLEEHSSLSLETYAMNHYNTFGRTYGQNQSSIGTSLAYIHKSGLGLYGGAESWTALGFSPAFYNLGISLDKNIAPWFDFNLLAERWFFPSSDHLGKNTLNHQVGAGTDFSFGNFTQNFSSALTWNKNRALQFESHTSYLFEKHAFWRFRKLTLNPEFSVAWGTPNAVYQHYRKITDASGVTRHVKLEYTYSKGIYHLANQFTIPLSLYSKRHILSLAWNYTIPYHSLVGENLIRLSWFQFNWRWFIVRGRE